MQYKQLKTKVSFIQLLPLDQLSSSSCSECSEFSSVQLRVASNHLTDIYLDLVNDLKTEQLQLIDEDTYVPQLIDDMTSIVGDSVPTSHIETECRNLGTLLHNVAQDQRLHSPVSDIPVRKRLSSLFLTPINAIGDRLRGASKRPLASHHRSTDSIDELLRTSPRVRLPTENLDPSQGDIGDSTLALFSSQAPKLACLPEADRDDDVTLDPKTTQHRHEEQQHTVRRKSMRINPKSASHKRRSRQTNKTRKQEPVTLVPETQPSQVKKVKHKQTRNLTKTTELYCLPDGCLLHGGQSLNNMVQCSHCAIWFHMDCVGLDPDAHIGGPVRAADSNRTSSSNVIRFFKRCQCK